MAVSMDVFSAFPSAVVSGVYFIGEFRKGTVEGNQFIRYGSLDVIIDEGDASRISNAPNAEPLEADLLLYVKPTQLPTLNPRALTAGFMIYDAERNDYFAIIDASIGKNQDVGELEHIELMLRQTEVVNE